MPCAQVFTDATQPLCTAHTQEIPIATVQHDKAPDDTSCKYVLDPHSANNCFSPPAFNLTTDEPPVGLNTPESPQTPPTIDRNKTGEQHLYIYIYQVYINNVAPFTTIPLCPPSKPNETRTDKLSQPSGLQKVVFAVTPGWYSYTPLGIVFCFCCAPSVRGDACSRVQYMAIPRIRQRLPARHPAPLRTSDSRLESQPHNACVLSSGAGCRLCRLLQYTNSNTPSMGDLVISLNPLVLCEP